MKGWEEGGVGRRGGEGGREGVSALAKTLTVEERGG